MALRYVALLLSQHFFTCDGGLQFGSQRNPLLRSRVLRPSARHQENSNTVSGVERWLIIPLRCMGEATPYLRLEFNNCTAPGPRLCQRAHKWKKSNNVGSRSLEKRQRYGSREYIGRREAWNHRAIATSRTKSKALYDGLRWVKACQAKPRPTQQEE
jgi:hypothetical protein